MRRAISSISTTIRQHDEHSPARRPEVTDKRLTLLLLLAAASGEGPLQHCNQGGTVQKKLREWPGDALTAPVGRILLAGNLPFFVKSVQSSYNGARRRQDGGPGASGSYDTSVDFKIDILYLLYCRL